MDIDVQKLRDHLHYGLPYHGDASRDTVDVLDSYLDALAERDSAIGAMNEARRSLIDPESDSLYDASYALKCAMRAKTKKEMKEYMTEVMKALEAFQTEFTNNIEYVVDLLKK